MADVRVERLTNDDDGRTPNQNSKRLIIHNGKCLRDDDNVERLLDCDDNGC